MLYAWNGVEAGIICILFIKLWYLLYILHLYIFFVYFIHVHLCLFQMYQWNQINSCISILKYGLWMDYNIWAQGFDS